MPAQKTKIASSSRIQNSKARNEPPIDEFDFDFTRGISTAKSRGQPQPQAKPAARTKVLASSESYGTGNNAYETAQPPEPSQSSDDGLMATIAAQMQASAEKKKKEKEGRFLTAAELALNQILSNKREEFHEGISEIDSIYAEFQLAYAAADDDIRKIWVALSQEMQNLQMLLAEKQKNTSEQEKKREEEHIQSLARGKRACEESQRLLNSLNG